MGPDPHRPKVGKTCRWTLLGDKFLVSLTEMRVAIAIPPMSVVVGIEGVGIWLKVSLQALIM